ncbi:Epithelial cell adhesion molecule [Frankliniella fusca]|uniref:Epithelial cell adhesion molecule n=1 Tax=Frankliniella fusca TaxID=407009 RepID=A0AAE1HKK4_9NEOP|nr:Epithelial cell adhesion molecule [Frankliniella fusca]
MPVFQSKNEKFHKYTEIKQNKPIVDGQEIFVKWVSPQAQPCHAHQALEDAGPSYVTPLLTQEEKEKNNESDCASESSTSSSSEDDNCSDVWLTKAKNMFTVREWEEMSKYERKSYARRLEKDELLKSLGFLKSDTEITPLQRGKSAVKRRKTGSTVNDKENVDPSKKSKKEKSKVLVKPVRRSKRQIFLNKTPNQPESDDEFNIFINSEIPEKESNDIALTDRAAHNFYDDTNPLKFREDYQVLEEQTLEETSDTAVSSSELQTKRTKVKTSKPRKPISERRKPQLINRLFGQQIRLNNALPEFSAKLKSDLNKGCYNTHRLNMEIRDHIEYHTGGLYLTRKEWTLLCSAIVREYPLLGDLDNRKDHKHLKVGIQKSITSLRYKKNEKRALTAEGETQTVVVVERVSDEMENHLNELEAGPVAETRVMWLIKKTLEVRQKELANAADVQSYLAKYPHHKNSKMLLYDYAVSGKLDLIKLHENSDLLLKKLRKLFEQDNVADNIDVILLLQEQLYPAALRKKQEGAITKLITVMNVTEAEAEIGVLDTNQELHSPCILLTVDVDDSGHRVIKSSFLKMFKGTASTYSNPTCSAVLLQLLSPYFLFNLAYPNAYNSLLRFLESIYCFQD